ncbi:hypothetical protein [Cesiribacter sp. SM1]|uniref:hypothetical protein n=1 Tax=Cesiribacter sp. SM1 TaxID=2861196 RepID=UPI001CD50D3E|nr:hypothetical protein [Cesiribacter sp. SM1]
MPVPVKQVNPVTHTQAINTNSNVNLTVTIGNAQIGSSLVVDNANNVIAKGDKININLGPGGNLKGRSIIIYTNILDVNSIDNGVILVDHFANVNSFMYVDTAPQGGIVSFTRQYNFL